MFLLKPLTETAFNNAYGNLIANDFCTSIKYFSNGFILVETMRIKLILEYYGDQYELLGQML